MDSMRRGAGEIQDVLGRTVTPFQEALDLFNSYNRFQNNSNVINIYIDNIYIHK